MGVIVQSAVPGVEHREHAGQGPEVSLLGTEILDRRGRNPHQQVIHQLLIAAEDPTLLTDLHRILMRLAVISGWLGLAFRGVCLISVDRSRGPWGIPTPSRL